MIIGHGITLSLEHDEATGEPSDYVSIHVEVTEDGAAISTHSGSRHVEATVSRAELHAFASGILRMLRRTQTTPRGTLREGK